MVLCSENVEENLKKIFDVAATWKAIVLIGRISFHVTDVVLNMRPQMKLTYSSNVAQFMTLHEMPSWLSSSVN
jgi:hypothetical protein